jgi:DNA-binding LacI/PurR family transcriptional regulator
VASRRPEADESVAEAVLRMHRQGVAGVIVIAPHAMAGESLGDLGAMIPLVLIEGPPGGELPVVSVNQRAGGRLATEHLLALGHSTVWHLAGPSAWSESTERTAGWRAALASAGASIPPLHQGDWSPASGYTFGYELADRPEISAVFVANDQMALGVLRALGERGRRVPDDVSVVGFDDIPEAGYFAPPLTTVRQPFDQVGRRSVGTLIAQIESGPAQLDQETIAPELVVRQSTAPPPRRLP